MILVRDVFRLHFGRAREAMDLAREGREIERRAGYRVVRILTDLVGDYYTLVFESEFDSLAEFERAVTEGFQSPEWQEWYARFQPLSRDGHREVFHIVH
jgi:hypothetical protein